jgi:hypothetical protein
MGDFELMFSSSRICCIEPKKPKTWSQKIFITFDLDWAHDEVILDTLELIKESGVSSTWFITHESSILDELRNLKDAELGIHPNFNSIQETPFTGIHEMENIVGELLGIVPEAKSVRSHSLFHSERLVDVFHEKGLTHISNCFIPHSSGIKLQPFSIWDDIVMAPHCWQDNVALKMNLPFPSQNELSGSYCVFNFHPIHVFLNTENVTRYESSRPLHQNPEKLIAKRFGGIGTRTLLIKLLDIIKTQSSDVLVDNI